ncbi:MAG: NFACT family protein [Armatimonadia bacterium]
MTCDSLMFRRIVAELSELAGAKVARVFPTSRLEVVIEFGSRRALPQVVLNCGADLGRVHRADDCEPTVGADTPLSDVLRRHLRGATFTGAWQWQFDRVLWLEFSNAEGLGPQSRRSLVAEIMGRHSNLLLLDGVSETHASADELEILECARHVTARVNRVRQSLPGEPYVPPPTFGKLNPVEVTTEQLTAALPGEPEPLAQWLRSNLQGGSDVFLAVLLQRLGVGGEGSTAEVAETMPRLIEALRGMLAEAEEVEGAYVALPPGKAPLVYPLPLPPEWEKLGEYGTLSAACQMLHRQLAEAGEATQVRQRLRGALNAALEKARRREDERQLSLDKAAHADEVRHRGDLVLAYLHEIGPQQPEVTVDDWDSGEKITIPLDPGLSPQQNAQALFDRYKKLQRVIERVPALLAEARQEREYLEDLLDQVEGAGLEELRLIEAEMVGRELLKAPRKRREVKVDYRRTEIEGYSVLYGRSGLENAAVLKAARPDDLWFHVQSAPGGHVVIRTDNRPDSVPQSTLIQAAKLAAKQSRRRRDATVEVDYTLIKHLQRSKGAPPGFVVYRQFRTLIVRPSETG